MEDLVRKKCVLNSSAILPSHVRCINSDVSLSMKGSEKYDDSLLEKNMVLEESNDNSNEIVNSFSACTLVILKDETQQESKQDSNNAQDTRSNEVFANKELIVRIDDAAEVNHNGEHNDNECKDKMYVEFSYKMKQLERKGLVTLDPITINKEIGKQFDEALCATCVLCEMLKFYTDSIVYLRRPFYDFCYSTHR